MTSKFPLYPTDGLKVMDGIDQTMVYDSETNSWVMVATDTPDAVVNSTQNGIITPDLVDSLSGLPISNGLKIYPNTDAYWYLIRSRYGHINIRIDDLTIIPEIDSSAIIRALSKYACQGVKGDVGDTGVDGHNSDIMPPHEIPRIPVLDSGGNIIIDVEVPIALDTNISTRIYDTDGNELVEIITDLSGAVVSINNNTVGAIVVSSDYSITSEILHLGVSGQWPDGTDSTRYKSRQIGPAGDTGTSGVSFPIVRDNLIDDADATAETAISTMRANKRNGLLYSRVDISLTNFPVSGLRGQTSNLLSSSTVAATLDSASPSMWIAIEPTVDDRKTVYKWGFSGCSGQNCDAPVLALPVWVPYSACHHNTSDGTTFDDSCFKWWENTTEGNPPFTLVLQAPQVACCQEDMFYCNEDINNCAGSSSPTPLILT